MPTGRSGTWLAVAILVAALGLLYVAAVAPVVAAYSRREAALAADRQFARRLRVAAAEVPRLQTTLDELRQRAGASKGESDAVVAAALQARVEDFAKAAGVTLGSADALPAETGAGGRRVGVRLRLRADYQGIVKLLAAIDAARPPLILDDLQIHSVPQAGATLGPAPLNAELSVHELRGSAATVKAPP